MINKPLPYGPKNITPEMVVVHALGEYILYDGVYLPAWEYLKATRLSAHLLIHPDGTVTRCRKNHQGAWHALEYNYCSLGVEFLVAGKHNYASFVETIKEDYITSDQYEAGVETLRTDWVEGEGILHYTRHSDVSPDRKVDPGEGFPWHNFLSDIGVTI